MLGSWPRQNATAAGAALLLLLISIWGIHTLFWRGFPTVLVVRQTASPDTLPARLAPVYQVLSY